MSRRIPYEIDAPKPSEQARPGEVAVLNEPSEEAVQQLVRAGRVLPAEGLAATLPDIDLLTLLQFIPDPRLKKRADDAAAAAMRVDVKGKEGVEAAEAALVAVRDALRPIDAGFDQPVKLSNMLHKRLTGLRADFRASADEAIAAKSREVLLENRRIAEAAEAARRKEQADRDAEERERAKRALAQAKTDGAPKAVQESLKRRAATATAPPVASPVAVPQMRGHVAQNWKARFVGTPDGAEPNPDVADMTPAQLALFLKLCRMVADGEVKPAALAGVNWSYFNTLAKADRGTGGVPGVIEMVDVGSLRGPRR